MTFLQSAWQAFTHALPSLTLARPWATLLLALAVVPFWFRSSAWWLRSAAIVALTVALAQPTVVVPGGHLAVVVDVSDSVGSRGLDIANALDLGPLAAGAEVVLAAADAVRWNGFPASRPATLDGSATDLARALQVAVANGAGRVLLVSDGIVPEASLLSSLPGVPVDVVAVPGVADVRVQDLLLPAEASPGQGVQGLLVVSADRDTRAEVWLRVDGAELPPVQFELAEGQNALPFDFAAGTRGSTRVEASVVVPFEQPTGNDHALAELPVRTKPPVLVIGDPAFAAALRAQDVPVLEGSPRDLLAPLPYDAIVVRGSSSEFTAGQLELLRSFVEAGGGLMMTGGPDSFGFGAWYRTPVEELLPVTTDIRTEITQPLVALVMVIDRSQSMSSGRPARIELAKEGALQVVELAYQEDLLGLIAFNDGPGTRWVFELRPASERGKREMAQGILEITPGGGTILEPAYRQALEALDQTDASVKHVIILSDGELYDGASPFGGGAGTGVDFRRIAGDALARGVTTSTIAVGSSADFDRLREIAVAGGGRYYAALDAGTLPRIFTDEALAATRALLVDEPTSPLPRPNQLFTFPQSLPPVDAYVATTLKGGAQELLSGRADEPILAITRVGLGRTAALTTDLNGWAGGLGSWSELPGLLGTLTRWLQAQPRDWRASAVRDGSSVTVTVDAVEAGDYVNNARVVARHAGEEVVLEQVAPGRYVGHLPWRPGALAGEVVLSVGSEVVSRARVGGPDPEYLDVDGAQVLRSVAARTGGNVIDVAAPYSGSLGGLSTPLWLPFVLLALALFLAELVWRKVGR